MRKRYEMEGAERNLLEDSKHSESNKSKNSIHSIFSLVALIFICLICALFGLVYLIDGILPKGLKIDDEFKNPDEFIAERAQSDLKLLVDIGPRLLGSFENEELAVDFLNHTIEFIKHSAHSNQMIEIDHQVVSGSYYIDYKPYGAINAYGNVQNVVVKLHAANKSSNSLLVNAHFDSAPTSLGGSDDGINCAVMLEVLRKLSRNPNRQAHNIIFLFNGAEESPLQASHGFITKHKWAKEVKVVINLEAAGAGGKEVLFQAGPSRPWLLNYYQKVPHPNGQAAGEELFQSGIIPSDTDFRIFRDFGNAIGMDFAFARDGYRYHTKLDGFSNIPFGSYQHVGDNALSLIRNLANAPELNDPLSQPVDNSIYYDVLGLFFISYSQTVAIIIHSVVSAVSLLVTIKGFYDLGLMSSLKSLLYILLTIAVILLGWILSGIAVLLLAFLLDFVNFTMSWYSNTWIVYGLYVAPVLASCCGTLMFFNKIYNKNNLSISGHTQAQLHSVRLIWTILLLLGTCLKLRFIYAIFIPLLFQTLTFSIIQIACLQHSRRLWQYLYFIGTLLPNMFLMQQSLQIVNVIIPICGRIGSDRNPEIFVGALVLILTIAITSYYVPLITLVRKSWIILLSFIIVFILFVTIVFTSLGFPYSGNINSPTPERFWIMHTSRVFRNESNHVYKSDSGFFILNMDRNSPRTVKTYIKDTTKSVSDDCDQFLLCGLPLVSSRALVVLRESTWVPTGLPFIQEPIELKLNSKMSVSESVIRFNFTATGPTHMTLYLSPRHHVDVIATSLVPQLPPNLMMWNGRPLYIIIYSWGKFNTSLEFSIDIEMPSKWNRPSFDIALTGKYFNEKANIKTPQYVQFLQQFPNWTDVIASLGTYESWVY